MYSNKIFEIFKNPSCAGGLQGANGIGKYIDEVCGDFVKIYLKVDENQEIQEARFKTMGSVGTIVASSVLCGLCAGMSITDAQTLSAESILEITGEFPQDKKCSLDFAIRGLNLAIADYFQKLEKDDKPKRKNAKEDKEPKKTKKQPKEELIEEKQIFQENSAIVDREEPALEQTEEEVQIPLENQDENTTSNQNEIEEAAKVLSQEQTNKEIDDEYDAYFNDYDEELFEDENLEQSEEKLDPVDIFLRTFGENAKTLEVKNMANGNSKVSLTSAEDADETEKASKMIEDARTYKPVVETKITKGDIGGEQKEQTKKSSAKAMFDAMFEE